MAFSTALPELLQPLFSHVSSLQSLGNLLRTSPEALAQFDSHGATIFEAVLSSRQIHEHTCALIRIATLVRSSALPPEVCDLTSFRDLVRHESTSHRYEPPVWTLPPTKLSSAVPASSLHGILAAHQKIECLVTTCLIFYLKRFKALRPKHLTDQSFIFTSKHYGDSGPNKQYVAAWELKPEETPFPVQDIGQPTWLEEQRVLRAFWRVQLFQDLKAARDDCLLSWPESDLQMLDGMSVTGLYNWNRRGPRQPGNYDPLPLHSIIINEEFEPTLYQQDTLLEDELIKSVMEYVEEDAKTIAGLDFLQTKRDWPTPVERDMDWEDLSYHNSATHGFFHKVSGNKRRHRVSGPSSPLQHISFQPFRRLGFAIWSAERMNGYGLLMPIFDPGFDIEENSDDEFEMPPEPPEDPFSISSVLNAWRSIVGQDELRKVEEENRRRMEKRL